MVSLILNANFKIGFFFIFILFLTGCTSQSESPLFRHVTQNISCEKSNNSLYANLTAEDNYQRMVGCLRSNQDEQALVYFIHAGTLTWYDYLVNPSETRRLRHHELLKSALIQLSDNQKNRAWTHFNGLRFDHQKKSQMCLLLKSTGDAKAGRQIFDEVAWSDARKGYIHCEI